MAVLPHFFIRPPGVDFLAIIHPARNAGFPDLTDVFFLLGKLCGCCVPTAAWALHVSRALRYHACAFEANDASAADCGLSRQSLATFRTNKACVAAAISTGDMRIRRSWMSWGVSQSFILVASPQ